jgi:5-enolpyruvylshikimate-3-phosphate synthase
MEIRHGRKVKGVVALEGDTQIGLYVMAAAYLSSGTTRLGNAPQSSFFSDTVESLHAFGLSASESASESEADHLLLQVGEVAGDDRSGSANDLTSETGFTVLPTPSHDTTALLWAGILAGRAAKASSEGTSITESLPEALILDTHKLSGDIPVLLQRLFPGSVETSSEGIVSFKPKAPHRKALAQADATAFGADDYLSRLPILAYHLASGASMDMEVSRNHSHPFETVLTHFEAPLTISRTEIPEGDELARRIARQMRAAGKQESKGRLTLSAGAKLLPQFYGLPGDATEGGAFALLATLMRGSDLLLESVPVGPGRGAFLAALRRMGADIEVVSRKERFGETWGQVRVRTSDLIGKRFDGDTLGAMRDEIFLLMSAACFAEGESVFRDLAWLRQGPIDRLKVFSTPLKDAGVEIGEMEDGLVIRGRQEIDGGVFDAGGHAGLGLAFAVLAQKAHGTSALAGGEGLARRYPRFLLKSESLDGGDKRG